MVMLGSPCDTSTSAASSFACRPQNETCRLENSYQGNSAASPASGLIVRCFPDYLKGNIHHPCADQRSFPFGESVSPSLPSSEQRAIAAVLSDVDELIGSLEALIAKKRAIKQAAMQELLTGRTRLPGFGGEWGLEVVERDVRQRPSADLEDSEVRFPVVYQGQARGDYPFFKVSDMNRDGNNVFLTESGNLITESTRQLLGDGGVSIQLNRICQGWSCRVSGAQEDSKPAELS